MVQILPLVGAAALLAQTAFGAAVPVKRTQYNNNYDSGSNQDTSASQETSQNNNYNHNAHQQSQDSTQYGNAYAYQSQESNQYGNGHVYQNQESSQYGGHNAYQTQESNQYGNGYAYQSQDSNQYGNGHGTTTVAAEQATETMMDETTTSTSSAYYETSSVRAEETSSAYYETSSVQAEETNSAYYSMPSYGSGSSQWNSGYNNCVSQCMAQFGAPPSTTTLGEDSLPSSTGTGAVHTVLVAPTGAGLRYVPFSLNATVGDTIRYVWTTPNNHTATLSSALAICNKSGIAEQRNFVSGVKNASQGMQTFDVTVETAEPQFFYCSVAQHCAKGMFGIINPANNIGGPNTVGTMMNSWVQSNPSLQAAYNYAMQNISDSSARMWGMGMSLDGIPESAYEDVAANILVTQNVFAANPNMLETGLGATTPDGSPVVIPPEVNVLLSSTSGAAPTTVAAGVTPSTVAPAATGSLAPVNAQYSGASRSGAGIWVAAVISVAGWLLI